MPQPNPRPDPPPQRRLAAVPPTPTNVPALISREQAVSLITAWAEQAEAAGDADEAARFRAMLGKVAIGFEFEGVIRWRVERKT